MQHYRFLFLLSINYALFLSFILCISATSLDFCATPLPFISSLCYIGPLNSLLKCLCRVFPTCPMIPFIHAPISSGVKYVLIQCQQTNAHTLLGHTQASHTLTNLTVLHTGDNKNVSCNSALPDNGPVRPETCRT